MMNRRQVLSAVAVSSFLTSFWRQAWSQTGSKGSHRNLTSAERPGVFHCDDADGDPVTAPTLNVVFHGPWVFVLSANEIQALTPSLKPHVYGAGNWFSEYALKEDTYTLEIPGRPKTKRTPTPTRNVLMIKASQIKSIDPDNESFCTCTLPASDRIDTLALYGPRESPTLADMYEGNDVNLLKGVDRLATAHVFTYDLPYESKGNSSEGPRFVNSPWYPQKNQLGSYNLHVFASPTFEFNTEAEAARHSEHAFGRLVSLLEGLDLRMKPGLHKVKYEKPAKYPGLYTREQGRLRRCVETEPDPKFTPPAICDTASAFVQSAS